tara:strand:+ start:883 stop:1053 length:171 start_codon:yes stop_codon:yes gene_type:complete
MKKTIFATIFIFSMIIAVGCIDGPTGYENNNWLGCFIFATIGIIFGILTAVETQEA